MRMKTAKLFLNGRSQAVRLPKECRFTGDDVYVKKFENIVILMSKDNPWVSLIDSLEHFSDDYMDQRNQPRVQRRQGL
jgi:antitoxin VapB